MDIRIVINEKIEIIKSQRVKISFAQILIIVLSELKRFAFIFD